MEALSGDIFATKGVEYLIVSAIADVLFVVSLYMMLVSRGSKQLKVLYATQAEVNPPTFVFFVNDTRLVHFSYRRYLENQLRQAFGFTGTPLNFVFKTRGES